MESYYDPYREAMDKLYDFLRELFKKYNLYGHDTRNIQYMDVIQSIINCDEKEFDGRTFYVMSLSDDQIKFFIKDTCRKSGIEGIWDDELNNGVLLIKEYFYEKRKIMAEYERKRKELYKW